MLPTGTAEQIAGAGITGALLLVALFALRSKDRELSAEKAARIDDSKTNLQLIMKLQEQVILAVNKLSDLVEIWEKRETERERAERATARSPYRGDTRGKGEIPK